jgi:hypothetical protein
MIVKNVSICICFFLFTLLWAEVSIRETVFLSEDNREVTAWLCQNDSQAQEAFAAVEEEAGTVLDNQPRPIENIYYEGILETDSRRKDTEDHLRDMDMLALMTMAYYGNPSEAYRDFIKKFVLAWATTYKPTGNPINENKLEAVYCGYYLVKEYFSQNEQEKIESWLLTIAEKENGSTSDDNWETKRFKIIGEIGLACNSRQWMDRAVQRYKNYVPKAIRSDGSTNDFHQRDALSYHRGGLRPLLVFCVIAEQMNIRVSDKSTYEWEASNGGSVKKAVHFFDPYVSGEKEHIEFENTTVNFDRERCEAGIEEYCPHVFDPKTAGTAVIYELASAFEPELTQIAAEILETDNTRYPTWLSVMVKSNAVDITGTKRKAPIQEETGMNCPLYKIIIVGRLDPLDRTDLFILNGSRIVKNTKCSQAGVVENSFGCYIFRH